MTAWPDFRRYPLSRSQRLLMEILSGFLPVHGPMTACMRADADSALHQCANVVPIQKGVGLVPRQELGKSVLIQDSDHFPKGLPRFIQAESPKVFQEILRGVTAASGQYQRIFETAEPIPAIGRMTRKQSRQENGIP